MVKVITMETTPIYDTLIEQPRYREIADTLTLQYEGTQEKYFGSIPSLQSTLSSSPYIQEQSQDFIPLPALQESATNTEEDYPAPEGPPRDNDSPMIVTPENNQANPPIQDNPSPGATLIEDPQATPPLEDRIEDMQIQQPAEQEDEDIMDRLQAISRKPHTNYINTKPRRRNRKGSRR